jgi:hypothetical protein
MKRLNFLPFAWVIFALLDPDPDPADQNQCGSIGIQNHSTEQKTLSQKSRDTVPLKVNKRETGAILYLKHNLGNHQNILSLCSAYT